MMNMNVKCIVPMKMICHYVGIGICAEKKAINKATGSLSLIR